MGKTIFETKVNSKKIIKTFMLMLALSLTSLPLASAGIITGFTSFGDASLIDSNLFATNNDNTSAGNIGDVIGGTATTFNWAGFNTQFTDLNPIDMSFDVTATDGTTEYFVVELVNNLSGSAWNSFNLELGIGVGDQFTKLSNIGLENAGLDFDAPDIDPTFQALFSVGSPLWTDVTTANDSILFENGTLADSSLGLLAFSIDIPDAPNDPNYTFTLRQTPGNTVVPEPATMLLFASGLVGSAITRKRKK